jgi:hypothetical protein
MVTTDGMTWFATEVTAHALTAELPELAAALVELDALLVQPATARAPPSATPSSHRRGLCGCSDSGTVSP